MKANIAQARAVIVAFASKLEARSDEDFMSHTALGGGQAIMTPKELIPSKTLERVKLLFGQYL